MNEHYLEGKVAIVTGANSSKRSKDMRLARKLSVFSKKLILKKGDQTKLSDG